MSERELIATMAAVIRSGCKRTPDEAVDDAVEILNSIDGRFTPEFLASSASEACDNVLGAA